VVLCTQQQNGDDHVEELKKTFIRTCSKYFQVKKVNSLKNNEDLSVEPDLRHLISLFKYAPENPVILKE
jgi:hypothetical protein